MHKSMSFVAIGTAACLAIPILVAGCSQPTETIPVSGLVTLDGEPILWGAVLFLPETEGAIASKASLRDGRFAFHSPGGLKTGQYLCVLDEDPVETDEPEAVAAETLKSLPAHLPERYRRQSDLRITVSRSSFDFILELTSANEE